MIDYDHLGGRLPARTCPLGRHPRRLASGGRRVVLGLAPRRRSSISAPEPASSRRGRGTTGTPARLVAVRAIGGHAGRGVGCGHSPRYGPSSPAGVSRSPLRHGCARRPAWLSTALHHFADPEACAHELGRVVAPEGVLLVRGLFADAGQIGWLDSFPGADVVRARMPSVAWTVSLFGRYGFRRIGVREVRGGGRETAGESAAWVRMMRSTDTLLALFGDDDFGVGLADLEELPADRPMTHHWASRCCGVTRRRRADCRPLLDPDRARVDNRPHVPCRDRRLPGRCR